MKPISQFRADAAVECRTRTDEELDALLATSRNEYASLTAGGHYRTRAAQECAAWVTVCFEELKRRAARGEEVTHVVQV